MPVWWFLCSNYILSHLSALVGWCHLCICWLDPENLTFGTIQTCNFCHTFFESWHPGVHETVGWACQSVKVVAWYGCQILVNALDDIKSHISATTEDTWTNLTMYLYVFVCYPIAIWPRLSGSVRVIAYRSVKLKKWHGYLWHNWTPFSVNSAVFSRADSSRHFSKTYIQYFRESYDEFVRSAA